MVHLAVDEPVPRQDLIRQLEAKAGQVFAKVTGDGAIRPWEGIGQEASNMIRMQRALSWLTRECELGEPDPDISFVLHWIAFEALYGNQGTGQQMAGASNSTSKEIMAFFSELEVNENDRQSMVQATQEVWEHALALFENPYINPKCWNAYYKGHSKAGAHKNPFRQGNPRLKRGALQDPKQFDDYIKDLFQRLYLLRNQLFHGNATHKGGDDHVRSGQINSGARVLRKLLPVIITCMLNAMERYPASERWGLVPYPRIRE